MRFIPDLTLYVSRVMIRLGSLPGLGFLQNYVFAARAMQSKFGDHVEDYEIYLMAGQDAMKEAKLGPKSDMSSDGAKESRSADADDEGVYDDYEWGDSSAAYHPVDDYPTSDDQHRYYDDDYRAN